MDESLFDVFGSSTDANANVSAADSEKKRDKERKRKRREHAADLLLQLASVTRVQEKQKAPEQSDDGGGAEPLTEARAESSDDEAPTQKKAKSSPSDRPTEQNDEQVKQAEDSDGELEEPAEDARDELSVANIDKMPVINVYQIKKEQNCIHEVAFPPNCPYEELRVPSLPPAKTYDFTLDAFQKEAILCLENNRSVLVSAHTSAGKTVVALYAIALALRAKQRVIYTSPIKALSNQKYRELSDAFEQEDVGLMTGDVTCNPDASILVMTTEILRSMLYKGSEVMREVGWVVFDEIHYMRDKERGVVWEETIILLPDNCHYVFLSATIPNASQFAEWICHMHRQPCHVVYTDYRPTPLQHFMYTAGAEALYEVVNLQGEFQEEKFRIAMDALKEATTFAPATRFRPSPGQSRPSGTSNSAASLKKIVETLRSQNMLPCIVFSFARKECENYASTLAADPSLDFNDEDDKAAVRFLWDAAMKTLAPEDRALPQVERILPFFLRGIGMHHSGLLPILKELTELLFDAQLIKTLFATETFAMGLNMPAKTVVFTSARKFDGKGNRPLNSGEYIQMSGRAGRRGKDDRGTVIVMVDKPMEMDTAKELMKGTPARIDSQFRLTYNMVLNLLRVPEINPEYMLKKSFYQFQNYSELPKLLAAMEDKKLEFELCKVDNELEVQGYYQLEKQLESLEKSIKERVLRPKHVVPLLEQGRLLKISKGAVDFGWTVLNRFRKDTRLKPTIVSVEPVYQVEVAVRLSSECLKAARNVQDFRPPARGETGVWMVEWFDFRCITAVSPVRLKVAGKPVTFEAKQKVGQNLQAALEHFNGIVPEVDPVADMKCISDEDRKKLKHDIAFVEEIRKRLRAHSVRSREDFRELCEAYERKVQLEAAYKTAREAFRAAQKVLQLDELECRMRVLRRLDFCDERGNITLKGRVACEIGAADELVATEMIFSGAFSDLSPAQAAALLSCFVFEENVGESAKLSLELEGCLKTMESYLVKIADITEAAKMPSFNRDDYCDKFRPHLMDVVYDWCSGATFAEILEKTQVYEGSIIRCFRRLEELLREMVNAAKAIGDAMLEEKFETARAALKRDIVFSASLYL